MGYANKYDISGDYLDQCEVYWDADNLAVDLNTLIDPAGGWILHSAKAISDTGWVVGVGSFDPDGVGQQAPYDRLFLIQVPEPGSLILLLSGLLTGWFIVQIRRK